MKTLVLSLLLLVSWVLPNSSLAVDNTNLADYVESISVKIVVAEGSGSGTAFTRKDWTTTNNITFIWTAAHVLQDEMSGEIVTNKVKIIQNLYDKDGIVCGTTNRIAKLIKISKDGEGQDLAILEVEGTFFNTNSATFDVTKKVWRIGTPLVTVGSPSGLTDSYSEGVMANVGEICDGNTNEFDQTTCVVFPGSSGSGIFDRNGVYVGMATVMRNPNINFIIPMRRMLKWVKAEHIEWTLNSKISMPSEQDYKKLPIMDNTNRAP